MTVLTAGSGLVQPSSRPTEAPNGNPLGRSPATGSGPGSPPSPGLTGGDRAEARWARRHDVLHIVRVVRSVQRILLREADDPDPRVADRARPAIDARQRGESGSGRRIGIGERPSAEHHHSQPPGHRHSQADPAARHPTRANRGRGPRARSVPPRTPRRRTALPRSPSRHAAAWRTEPGRSRWARRRDRAQWPPPGAGDQEQGTRRLGAASAPWIGSSTSPSASAVST